MEQKITIKDVIKKISENQILLPNFQRNFVWRDLDKQMSLLASILVKLPIGNILLLQGKTNEFAIKKIGIMDSNKKDEDYDTYFLLDGQQRLTTICNIFSNIIYDSLKKDNKSWTSLISPSLKNRFFLRVDNTNNIFGFSNFMFPNDPDEYLKYTTSEIKEVIFSRRFNKDDTHLWFHPNFEENEPGAKRNKLILLEAAKDRVIPLYLLFDNDGLISNLLDVMVNNQIIFLNESLMKNEISLSYIFNQNDINENKLDTELIGLQQKNEGSKKEIKENIILDLLKTKATAWKSSMKKFLDGILKYEIASIYVPLGERSRAIDIYENINTGGIPLSTFDLISAKYSLADQNNSLYEKLIYFLKQNIVIPQSIDDNFNKNWSSKDYLDTYIDNNNEVNSVIINQFLNLLSLISNTEYGKVDNINQKFIKNEEILKLSAENIKKYTEGVIKALNRTLSFLQFRCGYFNLKSQLNYDLMLLPIAYLLYSDDNYNNRSIINKVEYWYWASILSGKYNTDQSVNVIKDIKDLYNWSLNIIENPYVRNFDQIFNVQNFCDEDTILLKNSAYDIYPKEVIETTLMQFILKKKPLDFCKHNDEHFTLTSYKISEEKLSIHAHHIIPLGSVSSIEESSDKLRSEKSNILNSPINLTYITAHSNQLIKSKSPNVYLAELSDEIKRDHLLTKSLTNFTPNVSTTYNEYYKVLHTRYQELVGSIKDHLRKLLQ